jgi:peroxiredoxin Q/BCP
MLELNDLAPDFSLEADDGSVVHLSDLRGQRVVLFFYPKADTPGCTVEACSFRDRNEDYVAAGVVVLGISPDPVKAVSKFRKKFGLPYHLLADADHKVAELYDVWQEKSMYGRKYMGVVRTTFVIDEAGKISNIYEKVTPLGHADLLLQEMVGEG